MWRLIEVPERDLLHCFSGRIPRVSFGRENSFQEELASIDVGDQEVRTFSDASTRLRVRRQLVPESNQGLVQKDLERR